MRFLPSTPGFVILPHPGLRIFDTCRCHASLEISAFSFNRTLADPINRSFTFNRMLADPINRSFCFNRMLADPTNRWSGQNRILLDSTNRWSGQNRILLDPTIRFSDFNFYFFYLKTLCRAGFVSNENN